MKKTYIHPEMEIVEVQSQTLLAGSVFDMNSSGYDVAEESLAPEFGDDFVIFDE
jgi:hypothetical protein